MTREWKFVLIGQTPVPEPDVIAWALWFEDAGRTADRTVDRTTVGDSIISTVFIGVDFYDPPRLFETAIFTGGKLECVYGRCATWLEAEEQHRRAVEEKLNAVAQ